MAKTKYIVAGAIGVFSILGALAYLQYKKVMEYKLKLKGIKVRTIDKSMISFDVFLFFFNPSKIEIHIVEQEYKIYLNENYITRGSNGATNIIKGGETSEIGVNIAFNPNVIGKTIGSTWLDILLKPAESTLRVEITLKVKLWGLLPITIPVTKITTIKELLASKP